MAKKTNEINLGNGLFVECKETTPPQRFTESTFIHELEGLGIGRPSTFATIISTLLDPNRGYVKEEKDKHLVPTQLGISLVHFLKKNFPSIVETTNRANMEKTLDLIANGKKDYIEDLTEFYSNLEEEIKKVNPGEGQVRICPECGKNLVIRKGRYGVFLGCSGYPSCKHNEKLETK